MLRYHSNQAVLEVEVSDNCQYPCQTVFVPTRSLLSLKDQLVPLEVYLAVKEEKSLTMAMAVAVAVADCGRKLFWPSRPSICIL